MVQYVRTFPNSGVGPDKQWCSLGRQKEGKFIAMKKRSASISADRKKSSFRLNSHAQFQKFTTKNSNEINRMKEETMHGLNSLVK